MSTVITVIHDLAAFMQTNQETVTDDQARRALTMVKYSLENHCRHFTESNRKTTEFVGLVMATGVATNTELSYSGRKNLQLGLRDPTILPPNLTAEQTIEQLVDTSIKIRNVRQYCTVQKYIDAHPRSRYIWESVEYIANSYKYFLMDPMEVLNITLTSGICMQNDLPTLSKARTKAHNSDH